MTCSCRCHTTSGSFTSCDVGPVQPGDARSCMVTHNSNEGQRICPGARCGGVSLRDGFLCHNCQRRAERALGDLPALTRQLEITVTRQDRTAGRGKRGKGAEQPLGANLTAAERGRTVLELLFEWADHVAAYYQQPGLPVFAKHVPLTQLVPQAVAVLLYRSDFMRRDEQGPMLADAIHCVRRDLRRLVDQRPERLYAGPCNADLGYPPELDYPCLLPLFRAWGADEIQCDGHNPTRLARREWVSSGCGAVHGVDTDRRDFLTACVEDSLLPLPLILDALAALYPALSVETATQWTKERRSRIETEGKKRRIHVTPPRIDVASWSADDVPLYRGKDFLRLAADEQPRKGRRRIDRRDKMSA